MLWQAAKSCVFETDSLLDTFAQSYDYSDTI